MKPRASISRATPSAPGYCGSTRGCSDTCPGRGAASSPARRRRSSDTPGTTRANDRVRRPVEVERQHRPPGFSTRGISSIAARRSGTLRSPYPVVTMSKDPAGNGSASMSPTRNAGTRSPSACAAALCARELDHPERDVETDDARAARRPARTRCRRCRSRDPAPRRRARGAARSTSRRFQRRSCPYDSATVMKS